MCDKQKSAAYIYIGRGRASPAAASGLKTPTLLDKMAYDSPRLCIPCPLAPRSVVYPLSECESSKRQGKTSLYKNSWKGDHKFIK